MSEVIDNDTRVLEYLETQFEKEQEHKCGFCVEKAIWKRIRHACCGETSYVCGMHKYGQWTDGTPCWPGAASSSQQDPNITVHTGCGIRLTWTEVLLKDEWIHL